MDAYMYIYVRFYFCLIQRQYSHTQTVDLLGKIVWGTAYVKEYNISKVEHFSDKLKGDGDVKQG